MKISPLIIAIFITFFSNAQLSISTGYNIRVDHFKYGYSNFGLDFSYRINKFSISIESTYLFKNNMKLQRSTSNIYSGGPLSPTYETTNNSFSRAKLNYSTYKLTLNFVKGNTKCLFFKNAKGVTYLGLYGKIDNLLSFKEWDFKQYSSVKISYSYNPSNFPVPPTEEKTTYNTISIYGVSKTIYSLGFQLERRVYPKNNLYFGYKISMGFSDKIRLYNLHPIPDYIEGSSQTNIYTNPKNYHYFLFSMLELL